MKIPLDSLLGRSALKAFAGFLLVAVLIAPGARPQAAPGPLQQTQASPQDGASSSPASRTAAAEAPRTKVIAGTWRLNADDSDDPYKKMQQARGSGNSGPQSGRRGGGMGSGWPGGGGMGGGGMGGRGGNGGRGQESGGDSDTDSQKMHVFLEPSRELTITQKDPEIDVVDDDAHRFALFTDGRKVEKSKDANSQELSARWEGYRLVAEGKDPRGSKYERSYEVLQGNQQLRETLLLQVGRNRTEVSIRFVYDLVSPARPSAPETH